MSFFLIAIIFIVMLLGLAGVVLPLLPGLPLIFSAYLVYGFLIDWQGFNLIVILLMAVVTVLSYVIDYLAVVWGIKKYGASKSGLWGAALGALLGTVVFNFFGLIIGPIVGAFIGELIDGKPHPVAMKSGFGGLVGIIAGTFVKVIFGISMISIWMWQVFSSL